MLLLSGSFSSFELVEALITATIGVIGLSAALENYFLRPLNIIERVVLGAGALCLMVPGIITDIIGLGGFAVIYLIQKRGLKQPGAAA